MKNETLRSLIRLMEKTKNLGMKDSAPHESNFYIN